MLKTRVMTAVWGIPLVILAVYFDAPLPWFTVLAAVMGLLAAREFFTITSVRRSRPLFITGLVLTALMITQPHCTFPYALLVVIGGGAVLSLGIVWINRRQPVIYFVWTWMLLGVLYIGWLLSLLVEVRLSAAGELLPDLGRNLVFLALFATFGSDTLAYFIGRAFGRHKMAPTVSPGKTWEGAAGGLVGGIIVGIIFTLDTPFRAFDSYAHGVVLGLLVSVFGQFGDLVESKLKRLFGVKDAGTIMPGHGGVLDRLDSILMAGLVVYFYYYFLLLW